MKKKVLTLVLTLTLLVTAITGIFVFSEAEDKTAFDPDTYDYNSLYVKDGAILLYDALANKEGDTVNTTLTDYSGKNNHLTLSAINSKVKTEWSYGDGYLEISTGAQLTAGNIFALPETRGQTKEYTVEYLFSNVDKGLPQTTTYSPVYAGSVLPYTGMVTSYRIGGEEFGIYYVTDEGLANCKKIAAEYRAAKENPALQATFSFKPNAEHAAAYGETDGILDYEQTKRLITDYRSYYQWLDYSFEKVGGSRVSLTVLKVPGAWIANYDGNDSAFEVFRMPFGQSRLLDFHYSVYFDGTNYTTGTSTVRDITTVSAPTETGTAKAAPSTSLVLAKDVGARIYAVRVYERKLSDDEIKHNHIIDICKFYRLDPSFYLDAEDSRKSVIATALSSIRVGEATREEIDSRLAEVANACLETKPNEYTALYVQDGLTLMVSPMSITDKIPVGNLAATITDLDGNIYQLGSPTVNATWLGNGINLGLRTGLDLGAVLPEKSEYTVQVFFESTDVRLPSASIPSQSISFAIGPSQFREKFMHPSEGDVPGGMYYSLLFLWNSNKGLDWKANYDTGNSPVLFAHDYHTFLDFTNVLTLDSSGKRYSLTTYQNRSLISTYQNSCGEKLPGNTLQVGMFPNINLYGVLVYDHALSVAEMKQNHFANLMAYYKVDVSGFASIVDPDVKNKLYDTLSSVRVNETTKEELQNILDSFALTGGALGVVEADDYITFEGIQTRLVDYASARAKFALNMKNLALLEEVGADVEVGIVMMPKTETSTLASLEVVLDKKTGEYYANGENATVRTFYRKGEFFEGLYGLKQDAYNYFSAEIPAVDYTVGGEALNTQYHMRAYIAIDVNGNSFALYADADSKVFGDSISINEASTYFLYRGYADSPVLGTLCGAHAVAAAKANTATSLLANGSYDTASLAASLIQSAHDGAVEARAVNQSASGSITIGMKPTDAMKTAPTATTAKAQAILYATIGVDKYDTASEEIVRAREAAEKLKTDIYNSAIAAGATEEEAAKIQSDATALLLSQIEEVESYLAGVSTVVEAMEGVLRDYTSDPLASRLSKIFSPKATIFVNGKTLSRYTIITDTAHLELAEKFQRVLISQFGAAIGVYNIDNEYVGAHYDYTKKAAIMLGITSDGLTGNSKTQFSIYGEGEAVWIEGTDDGALEAAMATFAKTYCQGKGTKRITIDRAANATIGAEYIPLVAFNYGNSYPAVKADSFDGEGVLQVFMQKKNELPLEINCIEPKELAAFPLLSEYTYYVSLDGDDANAGTIDAPLKNIQTAIDKLNYTGGGAVVIRGGMYTLKKPLEITSAASGMAYAPTYITAYPGEEVVLTSAYKFDPSSVKTVDKALADGDITATVRDRLNEFNADNSKNVYVTYLNPSIFPKITDPQTVKLYVNDTTLSIARWPNAGVNDASLNIVNGNVPMTDKGTPLDNKIDDVVKVGKVDIMESAQYGDHYQETGGWIVRIDNTRYKDRILRYDLANTDLRTNAATYAEWNRTHHSINIYQENGSYYMATKSTSSGWGCREAADNNLYFYNVLEELDSDREFFIDTKTNMLYFYKSTPVEASDEIVFSCFDIQLMTIKSASNVIINGITFERTMSSAVTAIASDHIIVQNCNANNMTNGGVSLNGTECGIIYCDFTATGGYGASVTSNYDQMKASHNFIQNCSFHGCRPTFSGVGTVFSHNLIEDASLYCDMGFENIVEYNEFVRGDQGSYDSGPIYCSGNGSKRGYHIRYNYLRDLNVSRYGIYIDDMCSGNYVYGNVVEYAKENSGGGKCINLHNGAMNVVYNNIGINSGNAGVMNSLNYYVTSVDGVKTGVGSMSERWVTMSPNSSMIGFHSSIVDRFPLYALYCAEMEKHIAERNANPLYDQSGNKSSSNDADMREMFLRGSAYNVIMKNVMVQCPDGGYKIPDPLRLTTLKNNAYFSTVADAGFVDAANGNYNLNPDSPVFTEVDGFETIPFDRIGMLRD